MQVIDVDQQPDVAKQFRITGVPTYVAFKDGREIGRVEGAASYEKLAALWQGPGVGGRGSGARSRGSGVGAAGDGRSPD